MTIRKLYDSETRNALSLVLRVFMEYEAPEYSVEGVKSFKKDIEHEDFLSAITLYGAFVDEILVGVAATKNGGGHISLFFVESEYQGRGIGRKLFEEILADCAADKITVNSSPYAVAIYKKLGFSATNAEQSVNGIRFTPMVYIKENEKKNT